MGNSFYIVFCDALNKTPDKKLFEVKRKDQLNALKNLIELNDVNQQYKIIDIMLKGLFKVSFT